MLRELAMNKILKNVGFAVLYIYFFSLVFAMPYFNWRYARDHGFVSWLVFGEIIASAKAVIWPYYAVARFGPRSENAVAHTDSHYDRCIDASDEAGKVIARFHGITQLPPKDAAHVVELLQLSVAEAELVQDSYLRQVHPEFLRRFREEYTGSLQELADGIRTGDRLKQLSAATAYNNFCKWMNDHAKELKVPWRGG